MQGIFQKENTDKALKYGIYRHLPTYEKIIRNLVSFFTKKRPSTFRTLRPVNGLIFGIYFSKLAGGEQHFMLFADGKSTRDRRTSVARECSSLDGTK